MGLLSESRRYRLKALYMWTNAALINTCTANMPMRRADKRWLRKSAERNSNGSISRPESVRGAGLRQSNTAVQPTAPCLNSGSKSACSKRSNPAASSSSTTQLFIEKRFFPLSPSNMAAPCSSCRHILLTSIPSKKSGLGSNVNYANCCLPSLPSMKLCRTSFRLVEYI